MKHIIPVLAFLTLFAVSACEKTTVIKDPEPSPAPSGGTNLKVDVDAPKVDVPKVDVPKVDVDVDAKTDSAND